MFDHVQDQRERWLRVRQISPRHGMLWCLTILCFRITYLSFQRPSYLFMYLKLARCCHVSMKTAKLVLQAS